MTRWLVAVPAVTAAAMYSLVPGAILDSRDFNGYYRIREFTRFHAIPALLIVHVACNSNISV